MSSLGRDSPTSNSLRSDLQKLEARIALVKQNQSPHDTTGELAHIRKQELCRMGLEKSKLERQLILVEAAERKAEVATIQIKRVEHITTAGVANDAWEEGEPKTPSPKVVPADIRAITLDLAAAQEEKEKVGETHEKKKEKEAVEATENPPCSPGQTYAKPCAEWQLELCRTYPRMQRNRDWSRPKVPIPWGVEKCCIMDLRADAAPYQNVRHHPMLHHIRGEAEAVALWEIFTTHPNAKKIFEIAPGSGWRRRIAQYKQMERQGMQLPSYECIQPDLGFYDQHHLTKMTRSETVTSFKMVGRQTVAEARIPAAPIMMTNVAYYLSAAEWEKIRDSGSRRVVMVVMDISTPQGSEGGLSWSTINGQTIFRSDDGGSWGQDMKWHQRLQTTNPLTMIYSRSVGNLSTQVWVWIPDPRDRFISWKEKPLGDLTPVERYPEIRRANEYAKTLTKEKVTSPVHRDVKATLGEKKELELTPNIPARTTRANKTSPAPPKFDSPPPSPPSPSTPVFSAKRATSKGAEPPTTPGKKEKAQTCSPIVYGYKPVTPQYSPTHPELPSLQLPKAPTTRIDELEAKLLDLTRRVEKGKQERKELRAKLKKTKKKTAKRLKDYQEPLWATLVAYFWWAYNFCVTAILESDLGLLGIEWYHNAQGARTLRRSLKMSWFENGAHRKSTMDKTLKRRVLDLVPPYLTHEEQEKWKKKAPRVAKRLLNLFVSDLTEAARMHLIAGVMHACKTNAHDMEPVIRLVDEIRPAMREACKGENESTWDWRDVRAVATFVAMTTMAYYVARIPYALEAILVGAALIAPTTVKIKLLAVPIVVSLSISLMQIHTTFFLTVVTLGAACSSRPGLYMLLGWVVALVVGSWTTAAWLGFVDLSAHYNFLKWVQDLDKMSSSYRADKDMAFSIMVETFGEAFATIVDAQLEEGTFSAAATLVGLAPHWFNSAFGETLISTVAIGGIPFGAILNIYMDALSWGLNVGSIAVHLGTWGIVRPESGHETYSGLITSICRATILHMVYNYFVTIKNYPVSLLVVLCFLYCYRRQGEIHSVIAWCVAALIPLSLYAQTLPAMWYMTTPYLMIPFIIAVPVGKRSVNAYDDLANPDPRRGNEVLSVCCGDREVAVRPGATLVRPVGSCRTSSPSYMNVGPRLSGATVVGHLSCVHNLVAALTRRMGGVAKYYKDDPEQLASDDDPTSLRIAEVERELGGEFEKGSKGAPFMRPPVIKITRQEWLAKFTNSKAAMLEEQTMMYGDCGKMTYACFTKLEKMTYTVDQALSDDPTNWGRGEEGRGTESPHIGDPRGISVPHESVRTTWGPTADFYNKAMMNHYNGQVLYAAGLKADDMATWYNWIMSNYDWGVAIQGDDVVMLKKRDGLWVVESTDVSRFDMHIRMAHLHAAARNMILLGRLYNNEKDMRKMAHFSIRLAKKRVYKVHVKGSSSGSLVVRGTRASGDFDTISSNSFVSIMGALLAVTRGISLREAFHIIGFVTTGSEALWESGKWDFLQRINYPCAGGRHPAPKIGRTAARMFWTRDPISRRNWPGYCRGVALSVAADFVHVPIMRALVARVLYLTEGHAVVEDSESKDRMYKMQSVKHSEIDESVYPFLFDRYGITKDDCERIESRIRTLEWDEFIDDAATAEAWRKIIKADLE